MRPIESTTTQSFLTWCRLYNERAIPVCTPERRFSIGLYQLGQGVAWEDTGLKSLAQQSYVAAGIHFTMCAYALGLSTECYLTEDLEDLPFKPTDWREITRQLSIAQQMLIYAEQTDPRWRVRYQSEQLENALGLLTNYVIRAVEPAYRSFALYDETCIIMRTK